MKFGRQYEEQGETVPMAPLIDIVFLTLVFFMVTTVYATLESEVDITLPTADSAVQSERTQGEIFINLKSDGSIVVNERSMDLDELQAILNRVSEYFPGGAVIIRGDQEALLGRAIAVLDCCRKADIQNISFAAVQEAASSEDAE
jgi:biopolymer transport protein ExbD